MPKPTAMQTHMCIDRYFSPCETDLMVRLTFTSFNMLNKTLGAGLHDDDTNITDWKDMLGE
jgi:hypothetical protein